MHIVYFFKWFNNTVSSNSVPETVHQVSLSLFVIIYVYILKEKKTRQGHYDLTTSQITDIRDDVFPDLG